MKNFFKAGILMFCLLANVSFAGTAKAGFGISPPSLFNENLMPGSSYEQVIYLVRSEPTETLSATLKIEAGEATGWITCQSGTAFEVPKDVQQFPVKFLVKVPQDAKLGQYKGTITISTVAPKKSETAPVSVNLGAIATVDLTVQNNALIDYSIQKISINETKLGTPVYLVIKVQNKGNTPAGPTKVAVSYWDIYHDIKLWEGTKDISDKVGSFETGDINIELPNPLDKEGEYWADVEFFDGEKSATKTKLVFKISQAGASEATGQSKTSQLTSNLLLWIIAGALILILIIVLIVKFIFGRRKNSNIPPAPGPNIQ